MNTDFLEFEKPIAELEAKINELRHATQDIDITEEVERLTAKHQKLIASIFSKLAPAQVVQLARHPQRPHMLDYVGQMFTEFDELHGDRCFSQGNALVAGMARLDGQPLMVIGHQKGRRLKEKIKRNFGMPKPEDYRKANRIMRLAERFKLPIVTFIDTPGAYPGIGAEERNQSGAIAHSLFDMFQLKVPIVCCVVGEGGSGGALAIGLGDRVLMLEYAIYSVISPEGCASILLKDATKAPTVAGSLGLTADRLLKLGLIDEVVPEPLGGAHRNLTEMAADLKESIAKHLSNLRQLSTDTLLAEREKKWITTLDKSC